MKTGLLMLVLPGMRMRIDNQSMLLSLKKGEFLNNASMPASAAMPRLP